MKPENPENIVAKIVKSSRYTDLVKLWSSENGDEEDLPSEILEMVRDLSERINMEKKSFLRTFLCAFGLKPQTNIISFRVPGEVQDAKDQFDRELNKQMPVFIQVMNKIPAEDLIPASPEEKALILAENFMSESISIAV